jgi:DNA-binding response OmpR family regulator
VFRVVMLRRHPDATGSSPTSMGGRLNLLLSYAGWESDPWVDRLPRLLEPMGIMSHRAGSGSEATRVIERMPIHIAIVDLALPLDRSAADARDDDEFAEGGPRLLELLSRLAEPPPVVAVKRRKSSRDESREMSAALKLGAFAVVDRPRELHELDVMLEVLRRCLQRHYQGRWPG